MSDSPKYEAGDAIYARKAGNTTYAWYVISSVVKHEDESLFEGVLEAHAHREHSGSMDRYMMFTDVKKVAKGRWA